MFSKGNQAPFLEALRVKKEENSHLKISGGKAAE